MRDCGRLNVWPEGERTRQDALEAELKASQLQTANLHTQFQHLTRSTGIRLNKNPPDIYFKKKKTGGIKFNSMVPLSKMGSDPASLVHKVLQEYKVLISVVYIYI